jgi:hypothetical protein
MALMQGIDGLPVEPLRGLWAWLAVHPERYLLAFVYGHLGEHRLLGARNEAEKYLLLAALNLVECVAFAAAQL